MVVDDPYILDLIARVEARQRQADRLRESAERIRDEVLPASTPRLIEAAALPAPVTAWAEEFAQKLGITHRVTVRLEPNMRREGLAGMHLGGRESVTGTSLIAIDAGRLTENVAVTHGGRTVVVNGLLESLSHELAHAAHPTWSEAQIRAGVAEYWILQER